jgi:ribosomal protein L37E
MTIAMCKRCGQECLFFDVELCEECNYVIAQEEFYDKNEL